MKLSNLLASCRYGGQVESTTLGDAARNKKRDRSKDPRRQKGRQQSPRDPRRDPKLATFDPEYQGVSAVCRAGKHTKCFVKSCTCPCAHGGGRW